MKKYWVFNFCLVAACCFACSNDDSNQQEESQKSVCGDGEVTGNEECDDYNAEDGDGCSAKCKIEVVCGDGEILGNEECDDGNTQDGDGCAADCKIEIVCGDGSITGDEECDDGNTEDGDGCSSECKKEGSEPGTEDVCGDGEVTGDEECDDGNTEYGDGCSANCQIEAVETVCGDGKITGDEGCDDGNTNSGDGCSESCAIEKGYLCPEAGKSCIEDIVCGDGILASKEKCDDGNGKDGDGCSSKCVIEESYLCEEPGKPCKPEFDDKKSIKILGIGNSFMRDSTIYLHDILKEMGYTDITVGLIYEGGRTISNHAQKIRDDTVIAVYYLDKNGVRTNEKDKVKYKDAIESEPWDYFIMQQYPSGLINSYNDDIDYTISYVNQHASSSPTFGWSMTWAMQSGSDHYQMYYHGHDQMKMYEATILSVKEKIQTNKNIKYLIPVGTAIQNLRNGIFSDNLNRDGYHISYHNGRLAANYMWAKSITKRPIGKLKFVPDWNTEYKDFTPPTKDLKYTDRQLDAIKEAVINAYQKPLAVTNPRKGVMGTYIKANTELEKVFTDAKHNLSEFTELPFGVVERATFNPNCDADVIKWSANNDSNGNKVCYSSMVSAETGSKAADLEKYAASRIYSANEVPPGSFIVLKTGYQYMATCWTNLLAAGKNMAVNATPGIVEVNADWWGKNKYCAFTLSKKDAPAMTEDELSKVHTAMAIFVPKSHETDEVLTKAKYKLEDYKKLDLSIVYNAFWYPFSASDYPTGAKTPNKDTKFPTRMTERNETAGHYVATRIFKKTEIPNGSLIVAAKNAYYFQDGWVKLDAPIDKTVRPPHVQAGEDGNIQVVDDKWWNNFNYRGFDISGVDAPATSTPDQLNLYGQNFAIYVPVKK